MDTEKMNALGAELERITAQLHEALTPVFNQIVETLGQAAATIKENLSQISAAWHQSPSWEFILAYAWACGAHPQWVRTLNRTKKERTKKKYQDRILREYRTWNDVKGE